MTSSSTLARGIAKLEAERQLCPKCRAVANRTEEEIDKDLKRVLDIFRQSEEGCPCATSCHNEWSNK